MKSVLIFGAGSIGNHLAFACREKNWLVSMYDIDQDALLRTKLETYPSRYGSWDEAINLCSELPDHKEFDVVIIGTPPKTHIKLAMLAINKYLPKLVLIEKPLCTPDLIGLSELEKIVIDKEIVCIVGFNHNLSKSIKYVSDNLSGILVESIKINWLENWSGIFKAHPWLDGPHDSYLGYTMQGGGACHEHSHGIALAVHMTNELKLGELKLISSDMEIVKIDNTNYDSKCSTNYISSTGVLIEVHQDVVTEPTEKSMVVKTSKGDLKWEVDVKNGYEVVTFNGVKKSFKKNRKDDFRPEINLIEASINGKINSYPISLEKMKKVSILSREVVEVHFDKNLGEKDAI